MKLLEAPVQKAREKCTQSLQLYCSVSITLTYVLLILYLNQGTDLSRKLQVFPYTMPHLITLETLLATHRKWRG